jgi:hypothetical protein
MPTTTTKTPAEGVIEHDGMLWKPKRGATTSAEEFTAARTVFIDITEDGRWNPWVRDDRQAEYEQAIGVMDQWRRAEPGHRMLTTRQLEARWAKQDKQRERERAKREEERKARKAHHDQDRADARLALIEHRSRLDYELSEIAGYRDGSRFPGMEPTRRLKEIEALEATIERRRLDIERLADIVGDPEAVIDESGRLPKDRREYMLLHYRFDRERTVRKLREEIPELVATGEQKDRIQADLKRHRLNELLAVPPQTADDMCSDCPTPNSKHGWVTPPFDGPCPAWPGWGARLRSACEMIEAGAREAAAHSEPPQPKPQPLATIPSGLPIAEITRRLQELQTQFPDAEVRRGRANRWELWPNGSN